jgi:hypothetical protein
VSVDPEALVELTVAEREATWDVLLSADERRLAEAALELERARREVLVGVER